MELHSLLRWRVLCFMTKHVPLTCPGHAGLDRLRRCPVLADSSEVTVQKENPSSERSLYQEWAEFTETRHDLST